MLSQPPREPESAIGAFRSWRKGNNLPMRSGRSVTGFIRSTKMFRNPVLSNNSSVPQSALKAVSRVLDMRNEGQDSSYSAMKESPRNDRIGFAVSTGR
jgi:hypothetical protein